MKKNRMKMMAAGLLAAMALGVTGCGQKEAAQTTEAAQATEAAETTAEAAETTAEAAETTAEAAETTAEAAEEKEPVTILAAAAASLKYSFDEELIPMFQEKYPWITVEGTYDSSGKLQTQIEEGLEADIFMSAAMKQMNALKDQGLVAEDTVTELLENKIVLIVPADSEAAITSFEDIGNAEAIALGDPESVPVGQYSEEALTSLGIWDSIQEKVSFGTNVTEVLSWVSEGSADVGIVYATDAATTDKVKVIAEAPEGSLSKKVIYPAAMVAGSQNEEAAKLFLEFLQSDEAMKVFEAYGFAKNQ